MTEPEAWLRGPVQGGPDPLQPVAHALVQAREEARTVLRDFPAELLWTRPADLASVGFHLRHISGVIDRLFTYARGESLSDEQRKTLANEGSPLEVTGGVEDLLHALDVQVERALNRLRTIEPHRLTETRLVGRKQLPATMQGLLFHAAEHAQRHMGQLLVTARVQLREIALCTERLKLVPSSPGEVRAQIEKMDARDRAQLSQDWLARFAAATTVDPWVLGFTLVEAATGDLVGTCGFKGPPDTDGVVEIAYGIAPAHQNRGYATEAAGALVRFAFASPQVRLVRAHTFERANASARVLTKCNFQPVGQVVDPEDGLVWQWETRK